MSWFAMKKKVVFVVLATLLLLIIGMLYFPVWYDDAGHWLVFRTFIQTGTIAYPISSDAIDPSSQFITIGSGFYYFLSLIVPSPLSPIQIRPIFLLFTLFGILIWFQVAQK
ncbi:MAG: hypothetical protein NZ108_10745, partial [Bacteroidia bacterium]|nr:hypothetical protein [Bacteroidia bacterium]